MPKSLDVSPITLDSQRHDNGSLFPFILKCQSSAVGYDDIDAWVAAHQSELDAQLSEHGAILFRGFPIANVEDFDRFIRAFNYPNFKYEDSLSNAVRVVKTDRVFTANEAPPEVTIFFHHEMAQTPVYPSKLFFFCEKAAETGGATPLCRSDVLFQLMQQETPQFAKDCEEKGLKYTNVMPAANDANSGMGRSWQSTLRSETREQAEARLQQLNYTWEWLEDGCLKVITPVLPAVRELGGDRKSFFNQLIAAFKGWKDDRNDPSKSITFGDGTPLDTAAVMKCADLADEITFDIPWQAGDVALVDNYSTMHARRTFTGTRKVMASLVAGEC